MVSRGGTQGSSVLSPVLSVHLVRPKEHCWSPAGTRGVGTAAAESRGTELGCTSLHPHRRERGNRHWASGTGRVRGSLCPRGGCALSPAKGGAGSLKACGTSFSGPRGWRRRGVGVGGPGHQETCREQKVPQRAGQEQEHGRALSRQGREGAGTGQAWGRDGAGAYGLPCPQLLWVPAMGYVPLLGSERIGLEVVWVMLVPWHTPAASLSPGHCRAESSSASTGHRCGCTAMALL